MTRADSSERFARIAKALGHPLRARIVDFLAKQRECIVGELASHFDVAQSTMSEHLRVLKDAALVTGIIEGPRTCYCLDPETLAWFEGEVRDRFGEYALAASSRRTGRSPGRGSTLASRRASSVSSAAR